MTTTAERTKAENARQEALAAAMLPVNRIGDGQNVATLWNAATYIVDRRTDGTARAPRSGESLDSLLFGQRGKRIEEVQGIIEAALGKVQFTSASALINSPPVLA